MKMYSVEAFSESFMVKQSGTCARSDAPTEHYSGNRSDRCSFMSASDSHVAALSKAVLEDTTSFFRVPFN